MTWTLFYGGRFLIGNLSENNVDNLRDSITEILRNDGGWLDIQVPSQEGLAFARTFISTGIAMVFYPNIDNRALAFPHEGPRE